MVDLVPVIHLRMKSWENGTRIFRSTIQTHHFLKGELVDMSNFLIKPRSTAGIMCSTRCSPFIFELDVPVLILTSSLLCTHLAYESNRAYVFQNYFWEPKHYSWRFTYIPFFTQWPTTPLNALISGPTAGGPWDPG